MAYRDFLILGVLLLIAVISEGQEDSLRSALNAVNQRQKYLENSKYDDFNTDDFGYFQDNPEDLSFLSDYITESEYDKNPTRSFIDESSYSDSDHKHNGMKKRISSSFRERLEENKERQLEDLAQNYLNNLEIENTGDYDELIRELWQKYKNHASKFSTKDAVTKRSFYPRMGLSSAGLRKRQEDYINDNNYYIQDDYINNFQDPNLYNEYRKYQPDKKAYYKQNPYLYLLKGYPVAKRSSNYNADLKERKKPLMKNLLQKTDPQVERDLSNIFGIVKSSSGKPKSASSKNKTAKHEKAKENATDKLKMESKEKLNDEIINEKPIQIQKKSIDWSDYFGLDRRKKSDENLDNEWLMERYHKSIAMATKRNTEYPLQSFKTHDEYAKKEKLNETQKNEVVSSEEVKISAMDGKLKNMEEAIIDEALKYTGAHAGTTDSKEVQEVKDKIISRLAAAYSLEKMRRALGEYKLSIAKEREKLKQQENYEVVAEKRVSVPRKQAIDEEREKIPEADNNIKCTQSNNEDCEEQNYRTPSEILQQTAIEDCPKVQRACGEIATILGHYAKVFEVACNMHQMCLICSNNSWFAPTRQCNALFLNKAYELCDGKQECQKEAQQSVRYLIDVNRSLRLEPSGECELACPEMR